MSVWKKWSDEMHAFLLAAAANFRVPNSGCTISRIDVTGEKLIKPLLGVPAGVMEWGMSLTGHCAPKVKANGVK
jgi:hypothetical protein